jgi:signal transduction histidine kinase/tetratricopeptide (TPR) repeat protein
MRFWLLFLLLCVAASQGMAQRVATLPGPPDSLRQLLQRNPAGAGRVRALLRVADALADEEPLDSVAVLRYYAVARSLSQQLHDTALLGQTDDQLGEYYLEGGQTATAAVWLRQASPRLRNAPVAVRAAHAYHLAWLSEEQQQPAQAQRYYRHAIGLYRRARRPTKEAETTLFLGRLMQNSGQLDSAMVYSFQALTLYQQAHDTASVAAALTNIASILKEREDFAGSSNYLRQAYRLARQIDDTQDMVTALYGLALNASRQDSMAAYYRYMEQQLKLSRQHHLPLEANQYNFMAHSFEQQQPDSAVFYHLKAIRQAEQDHENTWMRGRMMTNLAEYYEKQQQPTQAAHWARQALALKTTNPADNYTVFALSLLGRQARVRHDYRTAYALLQQETKLNSAVVARRHTALAERVRARYEVSQAEQRVRLLQQDQELTRLRRQREWAGGVGLLLLTAGAAGAGVVRYRRRQREREAALRTRLAADLHDDVGSLLTQISLESAWLRSGRRSPEQLAPHLDHLADASRRAVQQLSDVVWGIDARNDNTGRVLEHMRDHAHEVLSIANLEIDFAADPGVTALALPQLTRHNLYLIYKEALHNVVKHARATLVTVRLRYAAGQVELRVLDDGCGYTGSGRPGGQGLRNMQSRAQAVGGSVDYEPQNPGFGVVVRLPLAK